MRTFLDFESSIAELEGKIAELKAIGAEGNSIQMDEEVRQLEQKVSRSLTQIYDSLQPWQKMQVARHPERPHFVDYARFLFTDFTPLSGDRKFSEDRAIIGGPARFQGESVLIIGHEKGADTASRLNHNFGMARPEGYRKAVRLMEMADRFSLPIISFIDTAGAYPGIGAEERGQAEAIARSTECCLRVGVPLISIIIGEGGSGGAVALATANVVLMLEHAIYSVISPEGASSILWRDSTRAKDAATAMKITADDLKRLGVIDDIIHEPVGGAHRSPDEAMTAVGEAISSNLLRLRHLNPDELRRARREKFLAIGRNL
ncbi:acetyl-CoA carboxylase carboxyl transferase subunit alpha [Rhodoligotrophos appendicifer]|uniref:acetyl-CoA carboxylase carboxyltransferase subunit alpha n=1 Tax=Rhodoligotrophos appendicifer TaxID=987056 RepID=UPI00117FA880|nr:acetyl-CoA carboxylase carboxyltransferase subunit alpha [Rhodoligotrophos appendicifer]